MSKCVRVVVNILVLLGATLVVQADEVTFKTAVKAPTGFDSWTFFWQLPAIEPDATLTYVVLQPDGKEYMRYDKPLKGAPGRPMRSDFSKAWDGHDPSVLYSQDVVFKFIVDKGKIKFDPKATFGFEFRNTVAVKAVNTTAANSEEGSQLINAYLTGDLKQARQSLKALIQQLEDEELTPVERADTLSFAYARLYVLETRAGNGDMARAHLATAREWMTRNLVLTGKASEEAASAAKAFNFLNFVDQRDKALTGGKGPQYAQQK